MMLLHAFIFMILILAIRVQYSSRAKKLTDNCQLLYNDSEKDVVTCNFIDNEGFKINQELLEMLNIYRNKQKNQKQMRLIVKATGHMPCFIQRTHFRKIELSYLELSELTLPFWKSPRIVVNAEKLPRPTLKELYVNKVIGVHNWNWAEVAEFAGSQIEKLTVRNSRWKRVPSNLSRMFNDSKITKLDISDCDVRYIDDEALDCATCKVILLERNDIRTLRRGVFGSRNINLQELSLKRNKIETLPKDLFENILFDNDGFALILEDNPLNGIEKEIFNPLIDSGMKDGNILLKIRNTAGHFICDCRYIWLKDSHFNARSVYCVNNSSFRDKEVQILKFLKDCD